MDTIPKLFDAPLFTSITNPEAHKIVVNNEKMIFV